MTKTTLSDAAPACPEPRRVYPEARRGFPEGRGSIPSVNDRGTVSGPFVYPEARRAQPNPRKRSYLFLFWHQERIAEILIANGSRFLIRVFPRWSKKRGALQPARRRYILASLKAAPTKSNRKRKSQKRRQDAGATRTASATLSFPSSATRCIPASNLERPAFRT